MGDDIMKTGAYAFALLCLVATVTIASDLKTEVEDDFAEDLSFVGASVGRRGGTTPTHAPTGHTGASNRAGNSEELFEEANLAFDGQDKGADKQKLDNQKHRKLHARM